jgi:diacylglycerol kinase (ATP)
MQDKSSSDKGSSDKNMSDKEHSGFFALLKRRLLGATTYSWQGLKACFKHEEAFRVEVFFAILLMPLALVISSTLVELVLLIGSVLLVLIVELLNSAIEAVVDRVGVEPHELAGRAKDQGSAAVMLAMGVFFITWLFIGVGSILGG